MNYINIEVKAYCDAKLLQVSFIFTFAYCFRDASPETNNRLLLIAYIIANLLLLVIILVISLDITFKLIQISKDLLTNVYIMFPLTKIYVLSHENSLAETMIMS